MSAQRELPLRDADNLDVVSFAGAICSEGQLFDVVVLVEPGALERLLELLDLRRQDACLQIHRGRRVLHRAVIDDDNLLNIAWEWRCARRCRAARPCA